MPNPLEIIGSAGARIARLAAIRIFLNAVGPALTAIALGLLLGPIGDLTWTKWGYALAPDRAEALSWSLFAIAAIALVVGAIMAWREYRARIDFIGAAVELDDLLGSQEQIVTLATLANPAGPDSIRARRTPLFPVLWRRAIACFEGFDERREFKLEAGEPLRRSSIFAGIVALAMILATLGLMRVPSPGTLEAARLRAIATRIAKTASSAEDSDLVAKIREAADALENPKLPPEEKKKRIEEAKQQAEKAAEKRSNSQSGNGQGTGTSKAQNGTGNSKGTGQGKSEAAGTGAGQGKSGSGEGQAEAGKGSGKNQGGKTGTGTAKNNSSDKNKGDKSSIELQNELAKAEAQVETADAKNPGPESQPGDDKEQGRRQQTRRRSKSERRESARSKPGREYPEAGRERKSQYPGGGEKNSNSNRSRLESRRYASGRDADATERAALPEAGREGRGGRYKGCAICDVPDPRRERFRRDRKNGTR